jgi:hypothetical protein
MAGTFVMLRVAMRSLRAVETRLAVFTFVVLAVYAPVETIASWQMFGGAVVLIHPAFLESVTGMVLLFVGARHSLRARPRPAPALLCVSHAWSAATWWHGATLRLSFVQRGDRLFYGSPEFWVVAGAAVVMVAMFAISLFLTYQAGSLAGPERSRGPQSCSPR